MDALTPPRCTRIVYAIIILYICFKYYVAGAYLHITYNMLYITFLTIKQSDYKRKGSCSLTMRIDRNITTVVCGTIRH